MQKHLVITVHGIRTFGAWQYKLENLLTHHPNGKNIHVANVDYGYFSVLAFWLPFVRWLATRRVRKLLLQTILEHPWERIDIVAHSFGTHLVGWSLRELSEEQRKNFNIHTIIFAGSVLNPRFNWDDLLNDQTGCVGRVINDCGTKDKILILSQVGVLFASMAGRVGFRGVINNRFRNRYFPIGHRGYFVSGNKPNNFMEKWWLPILTATTNLPTHDCRSGSSLSGLVTFLINSAEPMKMFGYSAVIYLLIHSYIVVPYHVQNLIYFTTQAITSLENEDNSTAALFLSRIAYLHNKEKKLGKSILVDKTLRKILEKPYLNSTLFTDEHNISSTTISPNGRWLALTGDYQSVWLIDLSDRTKRPHKISHEHLQIKKMAFGLDSRQLVAIEDSGKLLIWPDVTSNNQYRTEQLGKFGNFNVAAISHDAKWIAVGANDKKLRRWRIDSLDIYNEWCCHDGIISALAFHPQDSSILVSGSYDNSLRIWREREMHALQKFNLDSPVTAINFSYDGKILAVGTKGSIFSPNGKVIPPRGGVNISQYKTDRYSKPIPIGYHEGPVEALHFSPDGYKLASASSGDSVVKLWASDPDSQVTPDILKKHAGFLTDVLYDPKGRYLYSVDGGDRGTQPAKLKVWKLGKAPGQPEVLEYHDGAVFDLEFSPKEQLLASVGGDGSVIVYDLKDKKKLRDYQTEGFTYESISFFPDGLSIVAGGKMKMSSEVDYQLRVWDIKSNSSVPRQTLPGHRSSVKALAISSDQRWLASAAYIEKDIRLWDINQVNMTSDPLNKHNTQVLALAFKPESHELVWTGSTPTIYIADVDNPENVREIYGHDMAVRALEFNKNGDQLFSGGFGKTLMGWNMSKTTMYWNMITGTNSPEISIDQPSPVYALSFHDESGALASGGEDGVARLWYPEESLAEYSSLKGIHSKILSLDISSDGQYLAVGGSDQKISIWPMMDNLASKVCEFVGRNPTVEEWGRLPYKNGDLAYKGDRQCVCIPEPDCE